MPADPIKNDVIYAGARRPCIIVALVLVLLVIACAVRAYRPAHGSAQARSTNRQQTYPESDGAYGAAQTQKVLGVPVRNFPPPQGVTGFDELPANAPEFRFT